MKKTKQRSADSPCDLVEIESRIADPDVESARQEAVNSLFLLNKCRQLTDSMRQVFWMKEINRNRVLYVSPSYETVWGRACADLIDNPKSWLDSVHPEDLDNVMRILSERRAEGNRLEYRIMHPDGSHKWLLDRSFPMRDEAGEVYRYAGIAEDISDRKHAEAALLDSEQKYRELQEMQSDAILLIDDDTDRILDANPIASRLYGYTRLEFLDMKQKDLFTTPDQACEAPFRDSPEQSSLYHRGKDRTIIPVEVARRHFLLHGRRVHYAAVRDMSERHRLYDGCREEQSCLKRIIDFDPTLICVKDNEARIVLANRSLAEFFGIPMEELIGKTVLEYAWDSGTAQRIYRDDLKILNRESDGIEDVYHFRDESGRDQWAHVSKIPVRNCEGNVDRLIGMSVDITERKMMEKALARSENELSARNRELEETNTALHVLLKRMDRDKKELMENVLTNIQGLILPYVEKLESSRLDEVQKSCIGLLKSGLAEIGSPFIKRFPQKHTNLSAMEVRVANLIKAGKGNKEIAQILGISLNTVMTHRYHLRAKLGVKGKKVNLGYHLNSIRF